MSSFRIRAKHKTTGIIHEIWCIDDYFGNHEYGYIPNTEPDNALNEEEFYKQYDLEESTNENNNL